MCCRCTPAQPTRSAAGSGPAIGYWMEKVTILNFVFAFSCSYAIVYLFRL